MSDNNSKNKFCFINLRLKRSDRDEFKKTVKGKNGSNMQDVLEAFVRYYNRNKDVFKLKLNLEVGNMSVFDGKSRFIKRSKISPFKYGVMTGDHITIRKVYDKSGGDFSGMVHIKPEYSVDLKTMILYLRSRLSGCDVGLTDEDGILKLEYPIYANLKDIIVKENVDEVFESINKDLNKKRG